MTAAVPRIIGHGTAPLILEYVDMLTMAAITANVGLDLGIPKAVQESALAYLVVVLENARADRLEEDVHALGVLLVQLGAIEAFVLPPRPPPN